MQAHADHRAQDVEGFLAQPSAGGGSLDGLVRAGEQAQWNGPSDVKAMFGATVDFVADNRLIFDIGGNKYRLIVHVAYPYKRVLIKFVDTHKDYDRINQETV